MIPQHNRNRALETTKPTANKMRNAVRTARRGNCLIPVNDQDGQCHPNLKNCHLIGFGHLEPIAKNGYVYEWDVMDITHIVRSWIIGGRTILKRVPVIEMERFEPADLHIRRCTRRLACENHDGPVFWSIDSPRRLDPHDPEHQFLMAFRAMAGSLALVESVTDYSQSVFGSIGQIDFWRELGQIESMEKGVAKLVDRLKRKGKPMLKEMGRWQNCYLNRLDRASSIVSSVKTFRPSVRVACSSIYHGSSLEPVMLTIVPSQGGGGATIIATSLKRTWPRKLLDVVSDQQSELAGVCGYIADMLEREPYSGILHLAQETHHFAINKDDYDNPEIIRDTDRKEVSKVMARRFGL